MTDNASEKPHLISLFNPCDYSTTTLPCDLIRLSVEELRAHAVMSFRLVEGCFDLLLNGQPLPESGKVIDLGIGNGSVVVAQIKNLGFPGPGGLLGGPLLQQMSFVNPFAQAPAAVIAAGPPPPTSPTCQQVDMMTVIRSPSSSPDLPHSPQLSSPVSPVVAPNLISDEFCTYVVTSEGSRSLLSALESLSDPTETLNQLLPILLPRFGSLAVDHHAAKVVIGVVGLASSTQLLLLVETACSNITTLCDSTSGSEVLVAMVAATSKFDRSLFIDKATGVHILPLAVSRSMHPFCTSVNGRKVVQAILFKLTAADSEVLFLATTQNIVVFATNQCGCITVQRMYDGANTHHKNAIEKVLLEEVKHLLADPFGNYVLQHAVIDNHKFSIAICEYVKGQLLELSVNKFSSNVIEKCIQTGPDSVREILIHEMCQPNTISQLMQDAFGNYVVQSAVDNAPTCLLDQLKEAIAPLLGSSPYGYRIESKMQRRLKKNTKHHKKQVSNNVNAERCPLQQIQPQQ
eukprot:TRINITY_DN11771_c1_g1_i1.p1 TRINITY_DN11771_c1_g1~~TRINITY_DN11771_c1_g1_i1.p1  ORF type:complete len:517 (+),score=89.70 TRINITY_DN11771_c1_g1_i1:92-1642(+)